MDVRGDFAVSWTISSDPNHYLPQGRFAMLGVKMFDPSGDVLCDQDRFFFGAYGAAGGGSSLVFDRNCDLAIAWEEASDSDNNGGGGEGVYAMEWRIFQHDAQNNIVLNPDGTPVLDQLASVVTETGGAVTFPVYLSYAGGVKLYQNPSSAFCVTSSESTAPRWPNSRLRAPTREAPTEASPTSTGNTNWPYYQGRSQIAMDADGDLTVTYYGYGADMSETILTLQTSYMTEAMADPQNADILDLLSLTGLPSNGDADGTVEARLINVQNALTLSTALSPVSTTHGHGSYGHDAGRALDGSVPICQSL